MCGQSAPGFSGPQTLPANFQAKILPAGAGEMPSSIPQVMQMAQQMASDPGRQLSQQGLQQPQQQQQRPVIPVWYPAQNNWDLCRENMQKDLQKVYDEFTGEERDEQREVEATHAEKLQDELWKKSKGKFGKEFKPKMRTAHVHDIFQDWEFPGDLNSWFRPGEVKDFHELKAPARWGKLSEFSLDTPYPTVEEAAGAIDIHGGRVYQGALEDFYLIAGMQAVGMKPQLLKDIFCDMKYSDPRMGVFTLRLYKHGQWHNVQIDDTIPFDKDFSPLCATSDSFPGMSWPTLIEKAYAKLHRSWEGLSGGGHVEEVLTDLTGGCATRYGTTDVAMDRLWQYLYEMQHWCIFACNINEFECSKRCVPIEQHWAASIWRVDKYEGVPYVCVCLAAPAVTVRHLPVCNVPVTDNGRETVYGTEDGFAWLRIDDFVTFFDTIYECRLVNSDLGNLNIHGIICKPGYVPSTPWFEEMWAYQGLVYSETAPSFLIEVAEVPNELTLEVSQSDMRYTAHEEKERGREMQAPLLLRFYQCSKEVSDRGGGEIHLVHLSSWGHCRDACCGVKVMRPGKYLAMVSMPARYICDKMIFRTYSTKPIAMKPITQHRSWIAVNPAMPLDAIPYSLSGFMRVDALSERLPQMFDEAEGRGKPMANSNGVHRPQQSHDGTGGLKVVGKFGGRDAVATVNAAEIQDGCSIA